MVKAGSGLGLGSELESGLVASSLLAIPVNMDSGASR